MDVARLEPQIVGDDLGEHRHVALPLGDGIGGDVYRAERVDIDRRVRHRAALRVLLALFARQDVGEIAHVGLRRLDDRGVADAVETAFRAGLVAALPELFQLAFVRRLLERRRIVARVEQRARRGAVGEHAGGHEIPADHLVMVEAELDRDPLHQPLDGVVHLRTAEAPHHPRRALVGQQQPVGDGQVLDVVGARQDSVHAIERPRHRRAQEGAVIVELVEPEAGDGAVVPDRGLDGDDAVGRRRRAGQMFQPVLDPLDRPAGDPGGEPHQDDVGEHLDLHPEPAARIIGRAHAELRAGDAERLRDHGMGRVRPLEVGLDVVGLGRRVVGHRRHEALDGRVRVARIGDLELHRPVGLGERRVGVAVDEVAGRDDVRADILVDDGRAFRRRFLGVDGGLEGPVGDLDRRQRVFRPVTVRRDGDDHRLAHIADLADRERPLKDRLAQDDQKRIGNVPEILARQDFDHARHRPGRRDVDGDDLGMGVRRAQDRGVQRPGPRRQVVGEHRASGQEGRVLDPLDRLPDIFFLGLAHRFLLPAEAVPPQAAAVRMFRCRARISTIGLRSGASDARKSRAEDDADSKAINTILRCGVKPGAAVFRDLPGRAEGPKMRAGRAGAGGGREG